MPPLGNEVFEVDQEALAAEPGQDRVTAWEADEGGIDHLEGVDMEGLSVTAELDVTQNLQPTCERVAEQGAGIHLAGDTFELGGASRAEVADGIED